MIVTFGKRSFSITRLSPVARKEREESEHFIELSVFLIYDCKPVAMESFNPFE